MRKARTRRVASSQVIRGAPYALIATLAVLACRGVRAAPDPFEPLVVGLTEIGAPYQQGQLLPLDAAWEGIVGGDDDTSAPRAIVAARAFGSGRIVAISANGFWLDNEPNDNVALMDNCLDWLNGLGGKRVGAVFGVDEWGHLWPYWNTRGYQVEWISPDWSAATLAEYDVLLGANTWDAFTSTQLDTLESFVNDGGGLLLAGLGWSYPYPKETYPLNQLGSRFGIAWGAGAISDPTDNYDWPLAPRFHTFYPQVKLSTLPEALMTVLMTHLQHLAALGSVLEVDPAVRADYVGAHISLSVFASEFSPPHPALSVIHNLCAFITGYSSHPGFERFHKSTTYDTGVESVLAVMRERFYHTWKDASGHTAAERADIATRGDFPAAYRDLFVDHGVYLMDNTALEADQLAYLGMLFDLVPGELHDLSVAAFMELLVTPGQGLPAEMDWWAFFKGRGGAINLFAASIAGGPTGNEFPDDVPPVLSTLFTGAAAHELNHVVDGFTVDASTSLSARKQALIQAAGTAPINYLRSMLPEGFFVASPQEFFASMANQWFADSANTLALGLVRFDQGHPEPLNQALFFANVYSGGGPETYFYTTDLAGVISRTAVPLERDVNGNLDAVSYGGKRYAFTLDDDGNVLAYAVHDLEPTVARLAGFRATAYPSHVELTWETLFELRTLGFQVERALRDGRWQRITPQMIVARGADQRPQAYGFTDWLAPEEPGVNYRLIEVDWRGEEAVIAEASVVPATAIHMLRTATGLSLQLRGAPGAKVVIESASSVAGPWSELQRLPLNETGAGAIALGAQPGEQSLFYRVLAALLDRSLRSAATESLD